ncbi:MAG: beta-propeller fold lactonase family protein [Actinobacteria bacterium]|nr:beta-propeller fold lactonase family protein [Actinomycetota bacterium]
MRRLTILTLTATIAACALMPAAANARPLFTNLYSSKKIASFAIDASGGATPLPGSPLTVGGFVQSISITPDGRYLVTQNPFATDGFMGVYSIDSSGALTQVGGNVATNTSAPNLFAPDGLHMYAPSKAGGVEAFAFNEGTLTSLGTVGATPLGEMAITPDKRFLFAPDYNNPSIDRFAIQADGTLADIGPAPLPEAGGQAVRITPDGRFLIVITGPGGTDHTTSFAIGPDGSLTQIGSPLANTGAITDRSPISPDGRFLFVTNGNEDSVSTVAIASDGSLSRPLPDVPSIVSGPGESAVSTDGRFLFVQNQAGTFFQTFAIGANGELTTIGAPFATGGNSDGSTPMALPAQAPTSTQLKITRRGPGENSAFDATGSTGGGNAIVDYTWDFGDGTTAVTTTPTTRHKYKKAGIYPVSVAVKDSDGCSASRIFDGVVTLCNGAASARATASLDTPPSITKLSLSKKRFMPGATTKIKFRLSEKSRVTFTVKKGRKTVGRFRANGRRGRNSVKFKGRIKRRALANGRYKLVVQARDRKGGKSTSKTKRFTIR